MVGGWTGAVNSRSILLAVFAGGLVVALFFTFAVRELRAQGESGVFHACSSQSGLRLVSDPSECRGNETAVEWNVQGPEGPMGPQGPTGSSQVSVHLADTPPVSETRAAFIKFDGIDGESQSAGFGGWSNLQDFDQQFHIPLSSSGAGSARISGSPVLDDVIVSKEIDKASPIIAQRSLQGQTIPTVQIHLTDLDSDGQRQTYLEIEMKDVLVSSYQVGGSGQSDVLPTEEMSLNYVEIKVTYTELDANGKPGDSFEYQWNRQTASS